MAGCPVTLKGRKGTPRKGPSGRSGAAASARAFSKRWMIPAFSCGFTRSMRAIAASTSSRGLTWRWRTSSACAVASRRASSSLIPRRYAKRRLEVQNCARAAGPFGSSAPARQRHAHLEAHAPLAVKYQLPAERTHALADADQARAGRRRRAVAGREADAVVLDLQAELAPHRREGDAHAPGARVTRDVGERFLRDAVEGGVALGGEEIRVAVGRQAGHEYRVVATQADQ